MRLILALLVVALTACTAPSRYDAVRAHCLDLANAQAHATRQGQATASGLNPTAFGGGMGAGLANEYEAQRTKKAAYRECLSRHGYDPF